MSTDRHGLVLRTWTARVVPERVDDYLAVVRRVVVPHLAAMDGFRGAEFALRDLDEHVREILVITRWASAGAAAGLSGADAAWVPEEIRRTLLDFDDRVTCYQVVLET